MKLPKVIATAVGGEMAEHLGREKRLFGRRRARKHPQQRAVENFVDRDVGPVEIEMPGGRQGAPESDAQALSST